MTAKGRARAADISFTIPCKEKKLPAQKRFLYLYMKEAEAEAEAEASFTCKRVFILFPKGGIPCLIYLHSPPPFLPNTLFASPPPNPFVSSNQHSLTSFLPTNQPLTTVSLALLLRRPPPQTHLYPRHPARSHPIPPPPSAAFQTHTSLPTSLPK